MRMMIMRITLTMMSQDNKKRVEGVIALHSRKQTRKRSFIPRLRQAWPLPPPQRRADRTMMRGSSLVSRSWKNSWKCASNHLPGGRWLLHWRIRFVLVLASFVLRSQRKWIVGVVASMGYSWIIHELPMNALWVSRSIDTLRLLLSTYLSTSIAQSLFSKLSPVLF